MSFASTLYLCPILDLLLAEVPADWQPEIRLGLQEALVNAAKHGNQLDPSKTIVVRYAVADDWYTWTISDSGAGFHAPDRDRPLAPEEFLPEESSHNGRGVCILHQIFDRVCWNPQGTQLMLCKQLKRTKPKRRQLQLLGGR